MNEYQEKQFAKVNRHKTLTRKVAALLGEGWTVKEYDNADNDPWYRRGPDIVHQDGRSFDLALVDKKRVRVSANWPTQRWREIRPGPWGSSRIVTPRDLYKPTEENPIITVAESRGPEVLAREIKRRFLPEFTRIWGRIQENIRAENEFEDGQEAAFERIREECRFPDRAKHSRERKTSWLDSEGTWGEVRVSSAKSVEVNIRRLPVDLAVQIIKLARGISTDML